MMHNTLHTTVHIRSKIMCGRIYLLRRELMSYPEAFICDNVSDYKTGSSILSIEWDFSLNISLFSLFYLYWL